MNLVNVNSFMSMLVLRFFMAEDHPQSKILPFSKHDFSLVLFRAQ